MWLLRTFIPHMAYIAIPFATSTGYTIHVHPEGWVLYMPYVSYAERIKEPGPPQGGSVLLCFSAKPNPQHPEMQIFFTASNQKSSGFACLFVLFFSQLI